MEGNGFITKDDADTKFGKMIISSKVIKYSKLELAWRIGITVAMIALICLSVWK